MNQDEQEVAPGKKFVRAACPKDKFELHIFCKLFRTFILRRNDNIRFS